MPSPFPGMDPYLESPLHWRDVHHRLAAEISRRLSPRLAPRYVARLDTRLVTYSPGEGEISTLYPDVEVRQKRLRERTIATHEVSIDVADAVSPPPLVLRAITPEQVELITVEIRDAAQGRLITAIEILSPVNRRPGHGLEEYRAKRETVLSAHAHLLEIDLFRRGMRPPRLIGLPQSDYFIFLTRAERRNATETWPIGVRDPLPVVPVPLLPGDKDVPLNLDHALRTIYDEARYDLSIDYSELPVPPLSESDAAWVREVVEEREGMKREA